MRAIHRVQKVFSDLARNSLQQFIITRLLPNVDINQVTDDTTQQWLEKACVTSTLFATIDQALIPRDTIRRLEATFTAIVQHTGKALSPKAIHAIQTLIWKNTGDVEPDTAEMWCSLLRHSMFGSAGQLNKARIGRFVQRSFGLGIS